MVKDFTKDDAEKKKKKVLYPKKITPIEYDSVRRENETTQTPVTSLPASFVPAPFGYQNSAPIGSLKGFTKVAEDRPSLGAMEEFFKERTAKHISLVKKYLDRLEKHYPWHFTDDHDKSKYNDPEHEPYLYITWKHKMKDEDKDWEMPKKWKDKCDEATFHHIKTNKHHPEYWDKTLTENPINKEDRDKPSGKVVDATGMPDNYLLEMVADWCAMSEEKGNTPKEWADDNIGKRWKFSEFQKDTIYEAIDKIWDKGKKKAAKMFTKTSEVESKYLSIVQSPSSNMRLVYYKDKFVGTILNKEKEDIWGPEDNWGYSSNKFGPWTFGFSDPYDAVKALLSTEKIAVRIKPKPEEEEYQPPQNIEDLFRASIEAYQRGYTSPEIMRDIQKYIDLNRLEALQELQKQAQVQPGSLLVSPATQSLIDSPRIEIEPTIKAEIQDAVQQLVASDPSYFKGISKIVALHSGPYGQVSSEDPSVIHLNVQRIKNDIKQHLGSNFNSNDAEHREMFEEAVKQAIIEVVSHEKGHVLDYDPEQGFPGGEGVAEQESRKMIQRLFPQSASRRFCKKAQETFQKGDFVRLMHSPEEWGILTGRTKNLHGMNLYQVQFNPDLPDEFGVIEYKGDSKLHGWIPEDQLVKLESKPKEASLKTARDIGVPTAEVLFRDFMKFWMQYRSRLIQDYKKEGEDYTKADWANIFVDCWEDYTNKIQANLMQKQWDKDRIADFIEKLDEFAHAELDKYEIREGSVRYFTKQAQQTLTYGIDIDCTIADTRSIVMQIANKYVPIEQQDTKEYNIKDFTHGSQALHDLVFRELYNDKRLLDVNPIPGAIEKINELHDKGNRIVLITARPENWRDQTCGWLKNVGLKYDKLIFAKDKGQVAKQESIDVFIDDDIENIQDVRQEGVPAYLFSQPWNEDEAESHVMTEWKEVKAFCKRAEWQENENIDWWKGKKNETTLQEWIDAGKAAGISEEEIVRLIKTILGNKPPIVELTDQEIDRKIEDNRELVEGCAFHLENPDSEEALELREEFEQSREEFIATEVDTLAEVRQELTALEGEKERRKAITTDIDIEVPKPEDLQQWFKENSVRGFCKVKFYKTAETEIFTKKVQDCIKKQIEQGKTEEEATTHCQEEHAEYLEKRRETRKPPTEEEKARAREKAQKRYQEDEEFREKTKQKQKERWQKIKKDPELLEKERTRGRDKYWEMREDPERWEEHLSKLRTRWQEDPEWAEKKKQRAREWNAKAMSDPEYRAYRNKKSRENFLIRMQDPDYATAIEKYQKMWKHEYYKANPEYKQKMKERYLLWKDFYIPPVRGETSTERNARLTEMWDKFLAGEQDPEFVAKWIEYKEWLDDRRRERGLQPGESSKVSWDEYLEWVNPEYGLQVDWERQKRTEEQREELDKLEKREEFSHSFTKRALKKEYYEQETDKEILLLAEYVDAEMSASPMEVQAACEIIMKKYPQYVYTGPMYRLITINKNVFDQHKNNLKEYILLHARSSFQSFSKSSSVPCQFIEEEAKSSYYAQNSLISIVFMQVGQGIDIAKLLTNEISDYEVEHPEHEEVLAPLLDSLIINKIYDHSTKREVHAFTKFSSPRWTTEEKNRLKKLYLKYRQQGIPHHIIYKACAVLLGKSFLSIKQKLESMYDIDEELKPMKFEHWDKEKIDKMIQDLYRNGKPINRLRLPANLMYQITNHSLPKAKTCNFPAFYPSFDEAIAYNILAVGFERENGELTDKAIKTLQDAIKYYHRKEKMTHAWTKDEIVSLLQDAHAAGLPLTYSFFKSHPTIYKPLIGVERSLEGLRDSIRRNGYDWSDLVIEAVPEYVEFYTDDGKLKSSTEEMRVRRFMELNNIPFRTTSDSDKIKVTDPSLIEMGYKHFLPDFIIMDSNGAIQGIVEVFGSIADSAAANTADIYREKKKAKESFYSTLPYKFISINNNTDGVDLTDEILKTKFAIFMGV